MRNIADKLRAHLVAPMDSESAVVYLMAGLRILVEKDPQKDQLPALRLYCNWRLTWRRNGDVLSEPLDMWVTNNVAGFSPAHLMSFTEQQQLFNDLKTLDLLRRELSAFLGKHALPYNFCG
jgi:hypothetical protein